MKSPWRSLAWAAAVLAGLPLPAVADPDAAVLAIRAHTIIKVHCYRCHGPENEARGGMNYILDRDRLVARKKLVPGQPAESKIVRLIEEGKMPPPESKVRPGAAELAGLRDWIAAGAPVFPSASGKRVFLSEHDVHHLIWADLQGIEPRQRRFLRYLTLTHLFNAGLADAELDNVRHAVTKLVNSLSWHPRLTRPRPVDPGQTILRLDLRDHRWNSRMWDRLVLAYPYRISRQDPEIDAITRATGADLPSLRADWFVATASRPPFYHDFLQLPSTDRELERQLRVEVLANIQEETVARAGFNDSGVSRNNRLLERHDAAHGAYWRSYDFSDNVERQNLFDHPLGPVGGQNSFVHAGGEIIFNLPNGLQGYLLVDGAGRRIDRAPIEIVSDPKRPDKVVENGLSCLSCHVRGTNPKVDQVRAHVLKNRTAFSAADLEAVKALYPPDERMRRLMEEDSQRFVKALDQMGIPVTEAEPIMGVTLRYEGTVDLAAAAAELGLRPDDLVQRLSRSPSLARSLGGLTVAGGTVQRQTIQTAFPEIVRTFRLAEASPIRATAPLRTQPSDSPFTGHTAPVLCVALAPDGKLAASGSQDRTIRIWDVGTGRELQRLVGHADEVTGLGFTPDGRRLLSGSRDRTVRLWDLAHGAEMHRFLGHTDPVRCVAISPNGWLGLSAGEDRTVRLWDLSRGAELRVFAGHGHWVNSVAFSPDGQRVLSASHDRTIRIWDVGTGREFRRLEGPSREVYTAAFTPDGKQVVAGGNDRTIRIWDVERGAETRRLDGHANAVIAVGFDGSGRLLSGSSRYRDPDRTLRVWDLASGKQLRALGGADTDRIACLAFAPDGKRALSGSESKSLRLWNLSE